MVEITRNPAIVALNTVKDGRRLRIVEELQEYEVRFKLRHPPGLEFTTAHDQLCSAKLTPPPVSAASGAISTSGTVATFKALLATRAVGPGVATLTVVAKCAAACAATGLFPVAALRLPLLLIQIRRPRLILVICGSVLLGVGPRPVLLLIQVGLVTGALLRQIGLILIPELLLIVLLVEMRCSVVGVEVVGAIVWISSVQIIGVNVVSVNVVSVDIVSVNVIGVDVVAIDVVEVGVVQIAVVVVVAVDEGIGAGDVGIVVVDYRRVVPAASPGVPAPAAAPSAADSSPHCYPGSEREQAGGNHCAR